MANDTALTYSLYGKDVSASKALRNVGDEANKAHSHFANLKTTALGVFAGNLLTSGATALVGAIGSAVTAAADYQKLGFQTAAVLKSTGNAANTSVEGIQGLASNLESLSGVDEALIINSENVLATFTKVSNGVGAGNDVFDQATKAALNMSSALGTDLQGTTLQVGKALNDPIKGITALSRAGVSFTAQQKEQIKAMVKSGDTIGAQKLILGELTTEFGGAAEAAGKGFGGSMARLKDTVSDAGRNLATKLLPTITDTADALSSLLKGDFSGFKEKMSKLGEQARDFAINVAQKIKDSLPQIKEQLAKWGKAFLNWISDAVSKLPGKYGEFVIALSNKITATLPGLLDKLAKWREAFVAWIPGAITKLLANLSVLGAKLGQWIKDHGADLVSNLVQWAIAFAGFAIKAIPGLLLNLGKAIVAIGKWIIMSGVPMLFKLVINLGKAIIDGLWEGISKSTKGFTDKITNWFKENVIGGVKKLLGISSPSKIFADIGGNVVKGFVDGLNGLSSTQIANKFSAMVETINTRLATALDKAKTKLEAAKQSFTDFAGSIRSSVNGGISFADALTGSKDKGTNFLSELSNQAAKAQAFAGKVSKLIKMGLSESGINQILGSGQDAGTDIANQLISGGAGAIKQANGLLAATDAVAKKLGDQGANKFYQAGVDQAKAQVQGYKDAIAESKILFDDIGQLTVNGIVSRAGGKGKLSKADKAAIKGIDSNSNVHVTINVTGSVVQERDLAITVRDNIAQLMRRRGLNPSILGV